MQPESACGPRQLAQHGSKQLRSTPFSQNQSGLTQIALWEHPKKVPGLEEAYLTFPTPCPILPECYAQAGVQHHNRD